MDKQKANKILRAFGNLAFKTENNTLITFARQDNDCIKEIEQKTDEQLIASWKSLFFMNYIYGQVSLNEIQRISLLELELESRENINKQELQDWVTKEEEQFEQQLNQ